MKNTNTPSEKENSTTTQLVVPVIKSYKKNELVQALDHPTAFFYGINLGQKEYLPSLKTVNDYDYKILANKVATLIQDRLITITLAEYKKCDQVPANIVKLLFEKWIM